MRKPPTGSLFYELMSAIEPSPIRLGVNVDHVATLRQARGTTYPDPVEAALLCADAGADSITIHLREDRRHIQDHDLTRLISVSPVPVNLELAATDEMLAIASRAAPRYACLVPERCAELADAGIAVSLFIDADERQLDASLKAGTRNIEIHTGHFCSLQGEAQKQELNRIRSFAHSASAAGLGVHAGHGLTHTNLLPIAAIEEITELNIGHALIARAVFIGLPASISDFRHAMLQARAPVSED